MNTPGKLMMLFILTATVFTLTQCGSDEPTPIKPADVYLAGDFNTGTAHVPAYWKNGELVKLSTEAGYAEGVAVVDDDVYVIGYLNDTYTTKRVWKNKEMIEYFSNSNNIGVNAVKVFGEDIYVIGKVIEGGSYTAAYWKNGVIQTVGTSGNSLANDLVVIGDVVYVAGMQDGHARYWKDGVSTDLTDQYGGQAYGIAVKNNVVYVSFVYLSKLWIAEGEELTQLSEQLSFCGPGNLAIRNNEVYVIGYNSDGNKFDATYWKNGTPNILPVPNGTEESYGRSLILSGDDLYMIGDADLGSEQPGVVWKNFEMVAPYNGTEHNYVGSIFINK